MKRQAALDIISRGANVESVRVDNGSRMLLVTIDKSADGGIVTGSCRCC